MDNQLDSRSIFSILMELFEFLCYGIVFSSSCLSNVISTTVVKYQSKTTTNIKLLFEPPFYLKMYFELVSYFFSFSFSFIYLFLNASLKNRESFVFTYNIVLGEDI